MPWTPIDGRGLTLPALRTHIATLPFTVWRPSGIVIHNTAAPKLRDWHKVPGETRMKNLEHYFKVQRGWDSAPHAFVPDDLVWLFTPFNRKGTHSPSWNGTRIGIEMVGDFSTEDDDSGAGLKVKQNTVALCAMLCERFGWNPEDIKFHKEDPRTTHGCPGRGVIKADFIGDVEEYMGHAGDLDVPPDSNGPQFGDVPVSKTGFTFTPGDRLNMRERASASSRIVTDLLHGSVVKIHSEEMNGRTKWLRITRGDLTGWVSAKYVRTDTPK